MSPVIPFRRRSRLPRVLGAIAAAVIGFVATMAFLNWESIDFANLRKGAQSLAAHFENLIGPTVQYIGVDQTRVEILRPTPNHSSHIEVIDGDTVRFNGTAYRLVGFDTPERGDKARCEDERRRAEVATTRLRALVTSGDAHLTPVACACRPGQEGTRNCNYGRLCGSLSIGGRDVGAILIGEGLAHSYVCGATTCPQRRPWC
jgi:endonuclease YncB( thermonuclease family)